MSSESVFADSQAGPAVAVGTITAELRLEHNCLLLGPTLTTIRGNSIAVELDAESQLESGDQIVFLSVSSDCFEPFERGLATDPTITDPMLVDRYPDRRIYRVTVTEQATHFSPMVAAVGGRLLRAESHTGGWVLELRLPDREALITLNERCGETDIRFVVNHLRAAGTEEDRLIGLTAKQQYLLTVAYEEGYFEVPRGISQKELADTLEVSKSAVSQRLRRAMSELCGATL